MASNIRIAGDTLYDGDRSPRRGTSLLEFVGCLAAVAVGAVAGSLYLGVDLKSYGLSALKSAGAYAHADDPIAAPAVATALPVGSPIPETPNAAAMAPTVVSAAFETPIATPAQGATEPVQPAVAPPQAKESSLQEPAALTDDQRQTLTAAYWTALDKCMQEEVDNRTAGIQNADELQLFDFLTYRSEGHAAAAKQIAELSTHGVDPHVTAYAEKARAWHKEGAQLYGRALDLLTDAPSAQLSGPFVQSWQSAATQHRMEESLLQEKHAAVQTYLNHSTSSTVANPGA